MSVEAVAFYKDLIFVGQVEGLGTAGTDDAR